MRRELYSGGWCRLARATTLAAAGIMALGGCRQLAEQRPLVIAYDDIPATLDPYLHNETIVWRVLGNFYDALVRFTPDMRLEPSLAVAWEQRSPTTWRLTLRDGVKFHSGAPFGAADVVASFERARDHARSGIRHHLFRVRSVQADGDDAVLIETDGPAPDLLNRLTFLFIIPAADAGLDEISRPVGTGPYRFVKRNQDGSIDAAAWPSWRGTADVRHAHMRFSEGPSDADVASLLAGSTDLLTVIQDDQLPLVENKPGVRVEPQPRLSVNLLAITPRAAGGAAATALADPRVRRALLLGLNRTAWIGRHFRGNATEASQYVHPVVFGYDPTLQPLPYDPAEAKRLLAEAGFAEGFAVTMGHAPGISPVTDSIRDDLAKIGIRVAFREESFGDLVRQARAGEVPLFLYAWSCSTGDASDFLNAAAHTRSDASGLGGDNLTGFSDLEVDALLERADRELRPQSRLELLQRAQRKVLEALPVLPLSIRWGYVGVSNRIDIVTRHDGRLWLADCRWRQ